MAMIKAEQTFFGAHPRTAPGARLCRRPAAAASQNQPAEICAMPESLSTCCGWCFAHSRAPVRLRSGVVPRCALLCGAGTTDGAVEVARSLSGHGAETLRVVRTAFDPKDLFFEHTPFSPMAHHDVSALPMGCWHACFDPCARRKLSPLHQPAWELQRANGKIRGRVSDYQGPKPRPTGTKYSKYCLDPADNAQPNPIWDARAAPLDGPAHLNCNQST